MKHSKLLWLSVLTACVLAVPPPAWADKMDEVLQQLKTLSTTVQAQQDTLAKQAAEIDRLKAELGKKEAAAPAAAAVAAKPAGKKLTAKDLFGDRFSFSTDLRLRYEGLYNRTAGTADLDDRHRYRVRWRLFGDYRLSDEVAFHSMLTTSSGSWFDNGKDSHNWQPGRTSNQTLDEEFDNKTLYIGRIYATYNPKWLPGLEIGAGKFKNTFLHTDIMWDPDINPEGIYERYQFSGFKMVQPFIHLGQMVVSENNKTDDAYLFIYQAGVELNLTKGFKWTVAGSFYDWQGLEYSDMSLIEGSSAGNSVNANGDYVYDYKLVQGITFIDFQLAGLPVKFWFDYIQNVADDVPSADDTAWSAGFQLGKNKKKGDWGLYFKYAEIERDALIGAMADGDFYGANRKGYKAQFSYMLMDPLQFNLSWFQTDTLDGAENSEDRLQVDLVYRFKL